MDFSDWIASFALLTSGVTFFYTWYRDRQARTARLSFRLEINRSYSTALGDDGVRRIKGEYPPTTRLVIRNMGSRATAIIEIQARNPQNSVLVSAGPSPLQTMPIAIEPWGVRIIETTWPPGEHTERMYFKIKDIDNKEYEAQDATNNKRLSVGDTLPSGPASVFRKDRGWVAR